MATTFGYVGSNVDYKVPDGVTSINVYMWGAGGGGGRSRSGGAGAALYGALPVTPGETLTIMVGQAGGRADGTVQPMRYGGGGAGIDTANGAYYSATGGGRSAIRRSGADVVTVAGGGGGGETSYGGAGSATGTGHDGNTGGQAAGLASDGKGATTSEGGAKGTGEPTYTPTAGTLYTGGNAGNYCGGGGGGYYGGGGATALPGGASGTGGGGGGSSLTSNLAVFVGYNSSDGNLAPYTSSSYYNGTAAVGGQPMGYGGTGALGGNGLIVIFPVPPSCFTAESNLLTPSGYKSAADIKTGDLLMTADGRKVPVKAYKATVMGSNITAPFLVPKDSLGMGCPKADLRLSPWHAIQMNNGLWMKPQSFSELFPGSVQQYDIGKPVTYYHFEAPNFFKDNLICDGTVVESYGGDQLDNVKGRVYNYDSKLKAYTRISGKAAAGKKLMM